MKTLVLKVIGYTFMVDGLTDGVNDQKKAMKAIHRYLEFQNKKFDFSTFYTNAISQAQIIKKAAIDGSEIKGEILGSKIEPIKINSLVTLDIRDFNMFDIERYDPQINQDLGEPPYAQMVCNPNGKYISFEDAEMLINQIIELESKLQS